MGVLNVTPDSFSDGGDFLDLDAAVVHGTELAAEGADLVDVGGESTRPGAGRVHLDAELARVVPVIERLSRAGIAVSVDTTRHEVAQAAVAAGAVLVNDVSGGLADSQMLPAVADLDCAYLAMHWRGHSVDMQTRATYDDVVAEVIEELAERVDAAVAAGVTRDRLVIDPGLGFAKTVDHNWALLRGLDRFDVLGLPVLVGTSRKRFLGELLADADGLRPPKERDDATVALTALLAVAGVWGVRTHTVRPQLDAIKVGGMWQRG
ncbi:MAG: dihydropteroate synthase [Actinobacteria bacterium HGW-Actinobacteria-2]|nr:MAG: dihydropteroate synthase [Actinobacteria bacterium HGW-Actinobacteria-2]